MVSAVVILRRGNRGGAHERPEGWADQPTSMRPVRRGMDRVIAGSNAAAAGHAAPRCGRLCGAAVAVRLHPLNDDRPGLALAGSRQ